MLIVKRYTGGYDILLVSFDVNYFKQLSFPFSLKPSIFFFFVKLLRTTTIVILRKAAASSIQQNSKFGRIKVKISCLRESTILVHKSNCYVKIREVSGSGSVNEFLDTFERSDVRVQT